MSYTPAASAPRSDEPVTARTLLVGNPNVGKSVLFGLLTGRYAQVANYPGTTVEIATSRDRLGHDIIDTPGANSLLPSSEDERVTRDLILEHLQEPGLTVYQVCDAKNLRRGVALALQLAELEVPSIFLANMLDEARSRGMDLHLEALASELGQPVLGTVAIRHEGVGALLAGDVEPQRARTVVRYDDRIESALHEIDPLLPADLLRGRRGLALILLCGDRSLPPSAMKLVADRRDRLDHIRAQLIRRLPESPRLSIHRARMAAADRIVEGVTGRSARQPAGWLRCLGDAAMHPFWGLVVAAIALYALYLFVGVLGAGEAVDFLEVRVFGDHLTPWADTALRAILPNPAELLLVGPPGVEPGTGPGLLIGDYGLISMALSYAIAIVLPVVGFFFVAFSVMEDSGYLPRLAVVLNRTFRLMGLNGKAVLPMVLGLGCVTMATMTTRILGTKKERVMVTLLLALGVPCSAQLGVILGLLAGLSAWATSVWLGTVVCVLFAVGWLADKVLPGQRGDFILEIPPIRCPSLRNIAIKTLARIEWYFKEAVPLFMLGTLVLWVAQRTRVLDASQQLTSPLVQSFLGLPARATDSFLVGFLRRDYGAAGLYDLFQDRLRTGGTDLETEIQVVVAMVTITLFVPCIANVFMIVREHGARMALAMCAFIFPFAFAVGGTLNLLLRRWLL